MLLLGCYTPHMTHKRHKRLPFLNPLGLLATLCTHIVRGVHALAFPAPARHPCTNSTMPSCVYSSSCSSPKVKPQIALHEGFALGGQQVEGKWDWRWMSEAANQVCFLCAAMARGGLHLYTDGPRHSNDARRGIMGGGRGGHFNPAPQGAFLMAGKRLRVTDHHNIH